MLLSLTEMATESPIRMLESDESTKWLPTKDPSIFSSHFCNVSSNEAMNKVFKERIILEKQIHNVPNRSGSAPPTIEGSIAAFRAFMDQRNLTSTSSSNEFLDCESEEQMRTDPSYIAYYYANVKMNPRLPPPLISRENRDFVRLMGAFGGRKASVTEGLMTTHKEEPEDAESLSKASGDQREGFGDEAKMTEGNLIHASSPAHSTAANEEADHDIRTVSTTDQILHVQDSCPVSVNSYTLNSSNNFPASISNSCTRNTELEDNASIQSIVGSDISVVESRMKLLDVSCEIKREDFQNRCDNLPPLNNPNQVLFHPIQDATYHLHGFQGYAIPRGTYTIHQKPLLMHHQSLMPNPGLIPPLYSSAAAYINSGNLVYPHVPQPGFPGAQFGVRGYNINSIFSPHYTKYFQDNAFPIPGEVNPYTSHVLRPPFGVPLHGQYFQPPFGDSQRPAQSSDVSSMISGKELNLSTIERPVISSTNGAHISATYYGYPNASMNSPKSTAVPSGSKGQRGPESSDSSKRHCFLELLKSSSSRTFGLSDISGQIVEFSTDQHGSRFIQQKLENCGNEEKESVFKEILPHCSKLMTDVFGNYVVQKFFEHGTAEQRKKLGLQITGQVLTLSLQMYGCRVIQKALEVIELDQKVNLVQELDGHVLRCVHDQNGNHVIQKCIEYLPTEKINFILSSFAGQVATLSCHPYGCRVIQRVLEHCSDEKINEWIVDEILESTAVLAKDPYGNYVTQHILEMGKPEQRSQIIQKLRGQFVQLSQHKFASNVVEKCLKFGNASEQDFITEEILAQADNNEALLVMMKDQFANYVIQRIFEIGSEKQKDTLRNCIRLNLPLLKKVTYAKHIVSRYEQLEEDSEQERIKQSTKMDNTS